MHTHLCKTQERKKTFETSVIREGRGIEVLMHSLFFLFFFVSNDTQTMFSFWRKTASSFSGFVTKKMKKTLPFFSEKVYYVVFGHPHTVVLYKRVDHNYNRILKRSSVDTKKKKKNTVSLNWFTFCPFFSY